MGTLPFPPPQPLPAHATPVCRGGLAGSEVVRPAWGCAARQPSGLRETWRLLGWFLTVLRPAACTGPALARQPHPSVRSVRLYLAPAVYQAPGSPSEPVWLLPLGPPDLGRLSLGGWGRLQRGERLRGCVVEEGPTLSGRPWRASRRRWCLNRVGRSQETRRGEFLALEAAHPSPGARACLCSWK